MNRHAVLAQQVTISLSGVYAQAHVLHSNRDTMAYRKPQVVALSSILFTIACGGGSASSTPSSGGASASAAMAGTSNSASAGTGGLASGGGGNAMSSTSGGAVTVADDGKAFVPADIKYSIVDGGKALTLLSATLINDATGVYWLVAVRNDEKDPICIPEVDAIVADAADPSTNPSGQTIILIQAPMYQSNAGVHPCLLPGAIGMGAQAVSGLSSATPNITTIEYQPQGESSPEATKLPDLAVEGVMITNDPAGGKQVTGNVTNHGTSPARRPELSIFAVDSGGRPFDGGYASSMTDLAPGSSWAFKMNVPTPFNQYVAFPVWVQQ